MFRTLVLLLAPILLALTLPRDEPAPDPASLFVGRVVDRHGGAVAAAWIALRRDGSDEIRRARSDDRGKFRFTDLAPGCWNVELALEQEPDIAAHIAGTPTTVELPRHSLFEYVVDRNVFVRGRVFDPLGRERRDTPVVLSDETNRVWHMTADESGRFTFGPLPRATFRVRALAVTGLAGSLPKAARPGVEVRVALRENGRAAGEVVAPEPGKFYLSAICADRSRSSCTFSTRGRFLSPPLAPGRWNLIAHGDNGLIGIAHDIEVSPDFEHETVITAEPAARLHLVLHGFDDPFEYELLHDGFVFARRNAHYHEWSADTKVPAGHITVRVRDRNGREIARRSIDLRAGEPEKLIVEPD